MYTRHFGLKEIPFSIAPDPAYLYMSPRHQEALGHLLYGTGRYGGFVQLTGEVGTGKTTIIRTLLAQRLDNVDVAMIHNPRQSEREFVQSICDELHIAYAKPADGSAPTLKTLVDALNEYLVARHAEGRRTVLIIDEAQQLAPDVLEQVRLLTNLETHKEKLLRIMLVGQPELAELLARQDLRQLAQRITARYHLTPLSTDETGEYIAHRLQVAGGARDLFTPAAVKRIHKYSGGVPRLVNVLCDRALLGAYAQSVRQVTPEMVELAARETFGLPMTTKRRAMPIATAPSSSLTIFTGGLAVAILATTAGLLFSLHRRSQVPVTPEPAPLSTSLIAADLSQNTIRASAPTTHLPQPADVAMTTVQELDYPDSPTSLMPDLAGLWNQSVTTPELESACRRLHAIRLECLHGRAGLGELRRMDYPAIISLEDAQGRPRYALLTQLNEDTAIISGNAGAGHIRLADLQQHWLGEYWLLWRRDSDEMRIGPSNRGNSVRWLRKRLSELTGAPVGDMDSDDWDPVLQAALQKFQRTLDMKADGLAGARTLLALAPRENTPTLRQNTAAAMQSADTSKVVP